MCANRFPVVAKLTAKGAAALCMALACAGVQAQSEGANAEANAGDIALRGMGSFHTGGREVTISGQPVLEVARVPGGPLTKIDPNGVYMVEQMYAQYFLPKQKRGSVPLMLWHGGGLTGVSFETTPDGRDGWLNYFVRAGWDTYNADAVERGRAGFAPPQVFSGAPIFLTKADPYERFRIGGGPGTFDNDPARRKVLPGNLFPAEAYENFSRQFVPRWLSTDDAVIAGYLALVDKVCPCVLVVHSQGGVWAFQVAQQRPDKIKAIVAVEPAGFPQSGDASALKNIPVLAIYGDYMDVDKRWATIRESGLAYYAKVRTGGGSVTVIDLPKEGVRGNSHMIPMDKNSDVVAGIMQKWLAGLPGLYK